MAKRRVTPGTGQLNLEIESSLLERLRGFVRERDEKMRHAVEMAIRRHLDYPPPPPRPAEVIPLPPIPLGDATATRAAKRPKKTNAAKKSK